MAEVTLARARLTPILVKLAKALVEEGYDVNYVSFYRTSQFRIPEEDMRLFKNSFTLAGSRGSNLKDTLMCILKTPLFLLWAARRRGAVIGVSEPNWFVALVFLAFKPFASALIYSPYDITYLRFKDYLRNPLRERIAERFNFRLCDGIMHKGPEDELKLLPGWADGKPSLQFLPYARDDFIVEPASKGGTELAYVGGVPLTNPELNVLEVFTSLADQGFTIHVYALTHPELKDEESIKSLVDSGSLVLHEPLFGKALAEEISRFDWGLLLFFHSFKDMRREWVDTAYSNKIATYLEAGLPIIVNSELAFQAQVIRENRLGLVVDGVEEVGDKVRKADYGKMLEELAAGRHKLMLSHNIDRLMDFMEGLCG